jgi:hypothetical protein
MTNGPIHGGGEGGEQSEKFAALKVPRQCPLVLVEVVWKRGKALGSEEVDCRDCSRGRG